MGIRSWFTTFDIGLIITGQSENIPELSERPSGENKAQLHEVWVPSLETIRQKLRWELLSQACPWPKYNLKHFDFDAISRQEYAHTILGIAVLASGI